MPSEERIEGGIMMGVITDGISTPLTFSPMMCMASANLRVRELNQRPKTSANGGLGVFLVFVSPPTPHPSIKHFFSTTKVTK